MEAKKIFGEEEPDLAKKLKNIEVKLFNPKKKSKRGRRVSNPKVSVEKIIGRYSYGDDTERIISSGLSSSRNDLVSQKGSFLLESDRIGGDEISKGKDGRKLGTLNPAMESNIDMSRCSRAFKSRYEGSNTYKYARDFQNEMERPKESNKEGVNFISRMKLVNGFVKKLKEQTRFRQMKFLKDWHIKLISDPTHDPDLIDQRKKLNLMRNKNGIYYFRNSMNIFIDRFSELGLQYLHKTENFFQKWVPTIRPNGKTKVIWDAFITIFIVMKFFLIPIEIGFGIKLHQEVNENFALMNFITSIFFLCDIPLKFNTGFYHNGIVVLDKSKILRHYLKSLFIFDMLASVHSGKYLYDYITTLSDKDPSTVPWLNIFFFVKLVELLHLISNFEELLYLDEKIEMLYELIKLILQTVLFTHLIACIWHSQAYFNKSKDNWIDASGLRNVSWDERYLYSLTWAASSLLLTSYGEKISPTSNLELICGILLHFLSAGALCLIIQSMLRVFSKLNKKTKTIKKNIRILNRFMSRKNLNYSLQDRARKYLNFANRELQNENSQQEQEVVNKLSFSLKEEVLLQTNGPILMESKVFSKNFSEEFLKKIIFKMQKVSFMPEEIVYKERESKGSNIYFILTGVINLLQQSKKKDHLIRSLSKGETLGEKEFFTGGARDMTAISKTFSTSFVIKREDFLAVLKEFPHDMEKFCMLRDELAIYGKVDQLYLKCMSCGENHDFFNCNKIQYVPRKSFIIARYQFSKPQERAFIRRKRTKKFNSRGNFHLISSVVQDMLVHASFLDDQLSHSLSFSHSFDNIPDMNNNPNHTSFDRPLTEDISPVSRNAKPLIKKTVIENDEIDLKFESESSIGLRSKLDAFHTNGRNFTEKSRSIYKFTQDLNLENEKPKSPEKKNNEGLNFKFERGNIRNVSLVHNKTPTILTQSIDHHNKIENRVEEFLSKNNENQTKKQNTKFLPQSLVEAIDLDETNLFLYDFDIMRSFKYYFPNGNVEAVLKNIKMLRKKKRKMKVTNNNLDDSNLSPAIIAKYKRSRLNLEKKSKNLKEENENNLLKIKVHTCSEDK